MTGSAEAPAALVALGANLDDPRAQLTRARDELRSLGRVLASSPLYVTAPVGGPPDQPDYLNAVVAVTPAAGSVADARELLAALLRIEAGLGRVRRERWGPRRIDLDLLAYGSAPVDLPADPAGGLPALTLPHPRMAERAFVLAPLCDLLPSWRHPLTGDTACALLARLDPAARRGVRRSDAEW